MRKIINSTYISLDGVIQNPQDWPASTVLDEAGGRIQTELLLACDAVLMGRHTYDGFAPVWQGQSGNPYVDKINAMEKYVVSTTLADPTWNNTHVIGGGDVLGEIAKLKQAPGKDIVQYGFGPVTYALMTEGLLDELRLWVHPFFVGHGGPQDLMFRETPLTTFDLVDTTTLKSGIVILSYTASKSAS
jgi:dihydrofolate reductase